MKQPILSPLRDIVIVEPQKREEKTESGILIPETTSADKPKEGTVISVGPKTTSIKQGQKVLFSRYSPAEFELEGVTYLILREEDILATITY